MSTFNYAQLDQEGYCIGISMLSGKILDNNMILLTEYDNNYLGRKYDHTTQKWLDEWRSEEIEQISETLINKELTFTIEEKLNKIIEHLGIS